MTHDLKILPIYFEAVLKEVKTFEVRKNDRNFKTEDILRLREFSNGEYTGREVWRRVTYILEGGCYGLEEGYVILAIV